MPASWATGGKVEAGAAPGVVTRPHWPGLGGARGQRSRAWFQQRQVPAEGEEGRAGALWLLPRGQPSLPLPGSLRNLAFHPSPALHLPLLLSEENSPIWGELLFT